MNEGNTRVLLSHYDLKDSLSMLEELHSERDILNLKIGIIDLRLKDRLSLSHQQTDNS